MIQDHKELREDKDQKEIQVVQELREDKDQKEIQEDKVHKDLLVLKD